MRFQKKKKMQLLISRQPATPHPQPLLPPNMPTQPPAAPPINLAVARDVLASPPSPIIKIVIYFSKSEWQLAFFSLQQAVNHPALITFVTSLTPPARRSAREKWDLQQRPLHSHSRLQFIQNAEKLSNCGFYEILLTFHLISSSHFPPKKPRLQQFCTNSFLHRKMQHGG